MIFPPKIPVVIAHRGASGYLPEHTLPAKAMAHAQGADFLEQDLVLTRDGVPIVLHDIHLDTVTDVATQFPSRRRPDARFYAIDFLLSEIRQLNVRERFDPQTGAPVFPNRFSARIDQLRIPTFEEELLFIQALNRSTGRSAGIYPEIKQPAFHRSHGTDITAAVLSVLDALKEPDLPCFVQCFDPTELRRVREEFRSPHHLIQLLEESDCVRMLQSSEMLQQKLARIAEYANGIGPSLKGVFIDRQATPLVPAAHAAGLLVHPWTYRVDALTAGFTTFEDLHRASREVGVDGLFSDFPDRSLALIKAPSPVGETI